MWRGSRARARARAGGARRLRELLSFAAAGEGGATVCPPDGGHRERLCVRLASPTNHRLARATPPAYYAAPPSEAGSPSPSSAPPPPGAAAARTAAAAAANVPARLPAAAASAGYAAAYPRPHRGCTRL